MAIISPIAEHSLRVVVWGDSHDGTWYAEVPSTLAGPYIAARRALHDELTARDPNTPEAAWLHPVRVPELDRPAIGDEPSTEVYRQRRPDDE